MNIGFSTLRYNPGDLVITVQPYNAHPLSLSGIREFENDDEEVHIKRHTHFYLYVEM